MSSAKRVAANGRWTLGVVTHGAGDPNSHNVWAGVAAKAAERDVNLICFPGKPLRSPFGFEAQSNVLYDLISQRSIDGLVIWASGLPLFVDPPALSAFCRRYQAMPIVTVGIVVDGLPGVRVDNYSGMRAVVEHLVSAHGRKRVAFIRGPEGHQEAEERYRAYLDAIAQTGLPLLPELVLPGNFKESGGANAIDGFLQGSVPLFDALVGASDNMAIGAMKALQRRGVRVPDDVAIAGLNDEAQSAVVSPPLTTCPLHFFEQAERATDMALVLLEGQPVEQEVVLPTRLLARQSCGCPDPMVQEAAPRGAGEREGAAITVRLEPGYMLQRAEALIAETTGGIIGAEVSRPLVIAFRDAFNADRNEPALAALAEAVRGSSARFEPGRWHAVLSGMRRALLAHELSEAERARADDLFQQARVLVSGMAERGQAYRVLQAEEQSRRLAGISERLSTTIELRDLLEILAEALPELDVPGCYIALYEDPGHPADRARLVMAYGPPGQMTIEPDGQVFPSQDLAPRGLLPVDRRYSLSVQPLYFREDQIGFAVIEAAPEREEVYELLRGEISGALKRLQLLARNVELYREAVRGRVAAEEGRRLAEEANLLKSRFLATVSHELRTPLGLIVGASEMILRERENEASELPPRLLQDAESIRSSAQHLARLISDVLDLASSQAGELRLVKERLPMTEMLERAAALGAPMAREKGLSWRADIPPRLPSVMGDRTRLQQVVLNLVTNAVKFTERGQISLWAELSREEVLVAVTDSGMGIPLAEQEVIFDEFRRSERTTSRGYGGMGLGLAISRRIVELHGGKIGVISTGADGAGSTFYFTIPIYEWPEEADARPDSRLDTVLLLTEQPGRAQTLSQHLRGRGFTVETLVVREGEDWLGQITAAPPAAAVLDYEPATESGWRAVQALKLNPTTADIPVLFYSLFESQNAGAMLALDYLPKPIAESELSAALQRQGIDCDSKTAKTILIVDDEPGMIDLHARMVEASLPNCRILSAQNGLQALAAMQQNRPDLVLLDLMMPQMDGFTVLQKMREAESTRGTPVIVLTAQVLTQADIARLQSGVTAVLGKGLFSAAEVLTQVELALTRSKRLGSEGQRLARAVMAYLHEHYAEQIDREELARYFAVNERYLTRCFHQEMGIPPIAYLNRYRVRRACQMLEAGGMSITDVALSTGFSDSAYFARVFQRETGVTPSAYRRGERGLPA